MRKRRNRVSFLANPKKVVSIPIDFLIAQTHKLLNVGDIFASSSIRTGRSYSSVANGTYRNLKNIYTIAGGSAVKRSPTARFRFQPAQQTSGQTVSNARFSSFHYG